MQQRKKGHESLLELNPLLPIRSRKRLIYLPCADVSLLNDAVVVANKSAIISERTENGQLLYVGIIKHIPEGNYYATTPQRRPRGFTIHGRDVTEIDLRNSQ